MTKQRMIQVFLVLAVLTVYETLTRLQIIDPFTFIPFTEMVQSMFSMIFNKEFLVENIFPTLTEISITLSLSAVVGLIIGIILWRSEFVYRTLQPYLVLVYSIPFFAIYPVFISIFGLGYTSVIIVSMFNATVSVIINTTIGFRETRTVLIKVGRSYNLSLAKMLIHIYIPSAWPYIFTGLKLATAYSIIAVLATEFILATKGIGHNISYTYNNFDLYGMYGSILLVVTFTLLVNMILSYIESTLYKKNIKGF